MKGKTVLMSAAVLGVAIASGVAAHDRDHRFRIATALRSIEEVPAISSAASGFFKAVIDTDNETITYELHYEGIEGAPTQAHIHFGQAAVAGDVIVFLCSNGTAPAGTQTCPASPATITGTLTAANVLASARQGIAPGEFAEFVEGIRKGVTYANVHSSRFPGGEIRGQIDHPFNK
jgi:hypothetical protein